MFPLLCLFCLTSLFPELSSTRGGTCGSCLCSTKRQNLPKQGKSIPSRSKSEILNSEISVKPSRIEWDSWDCQAPGPLWELKPSGSGRGAGRTTGVQLSQSAVGSAAGKGIVWVDRDGRAMPYCLQGRAKGRVRGRYVNIRAPTTSNLVKSGQKNQPERRRGLAACRSDFLCHRWKGWLIDKHVRPGRYRWCCHRHKSEVVCLPRSSIRKEPNTIASPEGAEGCIAHKARRGIWIQLIDFWFHALGNPSSRCRPLPGTSGALRLPTASGLGQRLQRVTRTFTDYLASLQGLLPKTKLG